MKTLFFAAKILQFILTIIIVMVVLSMVISTTEDLVPSDSISKTGWIIATVISCVVFFLIFMLFGFAQGVANNSVSAAGAFFFGMFYTILTIERMIGAGDMIRLNTNASQDIFLIFIGIISSLFSTVSYLILAIRKGQIGEVGKKLKLNTKMVTYTLSFFGILIVAAYVLIGLSSDLAQPSLIPTGHIAHFTNFKETAGFFGSYAFIDYLLFLAILFGLAFFRDLGRMLGKLALVVGVSILFALSLVLLIHVLLISGNLPNFLSKTFLVASICGIFSICFVELITVFAHELAELMH